MSENPYPNGTFLVWNGVRYVHERKCTEDKAAAIAAEREACAKIAYDWGNRLGQMTDTAFVPGANHGERYASNGIAAAIRARGE